MNQKTTPALAPILVYQPALRPVLPCVCGPVDFRDYRDRLVEIDRMLDQGGVEARFVQSAAAEHAATLAGASAKDVARFARASALALRCNAAQQSLAEAARVDRGVRRAAAAEETHVRMVA